EHCHRLAIIHAGRLAALGTTDELKRIFKDQTIVEVHAASPIDTMRLLDGMREVAKTSVFGTAVHAVLHRGASVDLPEFRKRLDASGARVTNLALVQPSLEDVFLEVAEGAAAR